MDTQKPRKPYRGRFTRAHWDRWLAEQNGTHPHASALRAGILETRAALAPRPLPMPSVVYKTRLLGTVVNS